MNPLLPTVGFATLAIGSSVFAAFANILARTLLKDLQSKDILAINFLTMGVVLALMAPVFYYFEANTLSMSAVIGISFIDTIANYFYFKTFERTEASVATPILSLAPGFTFFFGWMILGDIVDIQTYITVGLIIAMIIYISSNGLDFAKFRKQTLMPALIASVLFGISAIPSKYLLDNLQAINAPTLYMFRCGWIALFSLLIFEFRIRDLSVFQYRIIFGRGLLVIAQWILFYTALTLGSAGVSVTLGNITPIFVLLLSFPFLKEQYSWKKLLGALLVLLLSLSI